MSLWFYFKQIDLKGVVGTIRGEVGVYLGSVYFERVSKTGKRFVDWDNSAVGIRGYLFQKSVLSAQWSETNCLKRV